MAIITYTSTSFIGGGVAVMIMFTLISLFLALYFKHMDNKQKEKYEMYKYQGIGITVPKEPQNILLISFCWFMFVVSSYMSLFFVLNTGEEGGDVIYYMTTLYVLLLTVIFIYLLVKYREIFTDKLKEWGFL